MKPWLCSLAFKSCDVGTTLYLSYDLLLSIHRLFMVFCVCRPLFHFVCTGNFHGVSTIVPPGFSGRDPEGGSPHGVPGGASGLGENAGGHGGRRQVQRLPQAQDCRVGARHRHRGKHGRHERVGTFLETCVQLLASSINICSSLCTVNLANGSLCG